MKGRIHKVFVLFLAMSPVMGMVSAISGYHLRMIDLIEANRSPIRVADDSELMGHFKGIWGIDNLEHLLTSVYKLKKERDEAVFFLSQLSKVAQEKDDFERSGPGKYYGHDVGLDEKYDALFRRLAEIVGLKDADIISKEMLGLKREWEDTQEMIKRSVYFSPAG